MEINLNTSRVREYGPAQPVSRSAQVQAAPSPNTDEAQALAKSLDQVPLSRNDKVAQTRVLLENVQYPPEELLNSIANLLAFHLKEL
jgi:hypothetical protein